MDIKNDLWFLIVILRGPSYARLFGSRCNVAVSWLLPRWLGNPGRGRALGVSSVKFTGEVLKNVKMAEYEINMKRILVKVKLLLVSQMVYYQRMVKIYSAENLSRII